MTEYGLFSDEGCIERQFYTREAAETRLAELDPDDGPVTVEELCPDHAEEPLNGCEECTAEQCANCAQFLDDNPGMVGGDLCGDCQDDEDKEQDQ